MCVIDDAREKLLAGVTTRRGRSFARPGERLRAALPLCDAKWSKTVHSARSCGTRSCGRRVALLSRLSGRVDLVSLLRHQGGAAKRAAAYVDAPGLRRRGNASL